MAIMLPASSTWYVCAACTHHPCVQLAGPSKTPAEIDRERALTAAQLQMLEGYVLSLRAESLSLKEDVKEAKAQASAAYQIASAARQDTAAAEAKAQAAVMRAVAVEERCRAAEAAAEAAMASVGRSGEAVARYMTNQQAALIATLQRGLQHVVAELQGAVCVPDSQVDDLSG